MDEVAGSSPALPTIPHLMRVLAIGEPPKAAHEEWAQGVANGRCQAVTERGGGGDYARRLEKESEPTMAVLTQGLSELVEAFLLSKQVSGVSADTLSAYRVWLKRLERKTNGSITP
jgi:hypothetical protein